VEIRQSVRALLEELDRRRPWLDKAPAALPGP
jgi:hypothetical protein